MEEDLLKIKELLLNYINIIIEEYPYCDKDSVMELLNSGREIVKYNDSNTISFFVSNGVLKLPKYAYEVFPLLTRFPNYGKNNNNYRKPEDYLDTNTTYAEYINHVIECALSVYDYFEESLLHEAMHICGSKGSTPLEEGINELKTRELAQKHNIKIAAFGYSKEVEIAKRFQNIVGKDVMDELTFFDRNERYKFLDYKCGSEYANLYELLSKEMKKIANDYNSKIANINNPYEKAKLYDSIDYSSINEILERYEYNKIR